MLRSQRRGVFVLVEGESDVRLFKRLLDPRTCELLAVHGKANVLGAIALLDGDTFPGVLALVDADRDRVTGELPAGNNVLLTDTCDLESMLIESPAFDKVLTELGSETKIKGFEASTGCGVRERLVEIVRPLGALRLVSERETLGLDFKELAFGDFVTRKDLVLDPAQMVTTVKNKSQMPALDEAGLLAKVATVTGDRAISSRDLGNGHDMVALLSLGLRAALGTRKHQEVTIEILERSLRLAYEEVFFRSSELCAAIGKWESRNTPYTVLPHQS
jgi:hypothetical protein